MKDSSGFSYQNTAYYAAYVFGLNMFFLSFYDKINRTSWASKKNYKIFMYMLLILQTVICLIAGGRGGFVMLGSFVIYYIFLNFKSAANVHNLIKYSIMWGIIGVVLIGVFNILNTKLDYSGFERIISIFQGEGDNTRMLLLAEALELFYEAPVFGHGLGAIFYEMEQYSHNFVSDIIVECGIIGAIFIILVINLFILKSIKLIKNNEIYHMIVVLFLCGIILNTFSGYWLSSPLTWFAIAYIFSVPRCLIVKGEVDNEKNKLKSN